MKSSTNKIAQFIDKGLAYNEIIAQGPKYNPIEAVGCIKLKKCQEGVNPAEVKLHLETELASGRSRKSKPAQGWLASTFVADEVC